MNSKQEYPLNGKSESNDESIGKYNYICGKLLFLTIRQPKSGIKLKTKKKKKKQKRSRRQKFQMLRLREKLSFSTSLNKSQKNKTQLRSRW